MHASVNYILTAIRPVFTNYTSKDVSIPDDFLTSVPADSKPITVHPIDFLSTVLPEYNGCYAVVLENVLSPSECLELLSLAEQSVIDPISETEAWKPAMVNVGNGYELLVRMLCQKFLICLGMISRSLKDS